MNLVAYAWGYAAALLAVGVLDGLWLGVLARNFYQAEMVAVAAESFKPVPAAMFYLLYPAGLLALSLTPTVSGWAQALGRSALLGLITYGVYDLTNMATLKGWSIKLALVDASWGAFVTGVAGLCAYAAMTWSASSIAR